MMSESMYYAPSAERKAGSFGMVAVAAVLGFIGAASLTHLATAQFYAPSTISPALATQVAPAPAQRMLTPLQAAVETADMGAAEDTTSSEAPQATNPAVYGLFAIPVGLLALAMRRNTTKPADLETGLNPMQVGAAGVLAASLTQPAMAAEQVAAVAEGDGRLAILLALLAPAVGWVGFNILQPALRQLEAMQAKNDGRPPSRSAPNRAAPKKR
eukprot:TRINITY_DN144_c0_g1_i1.p1 TRINITY_DN144_c0_g1~~TRINITY_DN144_c0_g1_i1.p1  ORF type:complete len:226 (+),score=22.66 TRINITY_DN144_c0_g1_i1:38-679(+)